MARTFTRAELEAIRDRLDETFDAELEVLADALGVNPPPRGYRPRGMPSNAGGAPMSSESINGVRGRILGEVNRRLARLP